MANALNTLERVKTFEIDEQRQLLVAEQEQEEALKLSLKTLNEDYEREKVFAKENPVDFDFGLYTDVYLKKKEDLEAKIKQVEQKIEAIRDVISAIFKEQKTYEIIDENHKRLQQQKQAAQEQKMLDEIGTNTYIKKHQD
ncbi:MAG: flagellar FliJ family protein [Alphaproteobacteria bacterium]|nr:flagellar FliJ family protein [Alphaproteobacteria bacterium]